MRLKTELPTPYDLSWWWDVKLIQTKKVYEGIKILDWTWNIQSLVRTCYVSFLRYLTISDSCKVERIVCWVQCWSIIWLELLAELWSSDVTDNTPPDLSSCWSHFALDWPSHIVHFPFTFLKNWHVSSWLSWDSFFFFLKWFNVMWTLETLARLGIGTF